MERKYRSTPDGGEKQSYLEFYSTASTRQTEADAKVLTGRISREPNGPVMRQFIELRIMVTKAHKVTNKSGEKAWR